MGLTQFAQQGLYVLLYDISFVLLVAQMQKNATVKLSTV